MEMAMTASIRSGRAAATNIDRMMEILGIDPGYSTAPMFDLAFSCALRTCGSCNAHETCTDWLAHAPDALIGPPEFCPSAELLWELLCSPGIGHRTHSVH
jgi:uncharacterized protein DUF6455